MSEEKVAIYYSVVPDKISRNGKPYEMLVSAPKKSSYLNCKYYFDNIEKARLFALYNWFSEVSVIQILIALFSGELFLKNIPFEMISQRITAATELFSKSNWRSYVKVDDNGSQYFISNFAFGPPLFDRNIPINDIIHFEPIVEQVRDFISILKIKITKPCPAEIFDQALIFGKFNREIVLKGQQVITEMLGQSLFEDGSSVSETNFEIVAPMLCSSFLWLTVDDVKKIFFVENDLSDLLKQAVAESKITYYYYQPIDANLYFAKDVIYWIVDNYYLPKWMWNSNQPFWGEYLSDLRRDVCRANQHDFLPQNFWFNSIDKLEKINISKNDIYQAAISEKTPLFLKYDPSELQYLDYIDNSSLYKTFDLTPPYVSDEKNEFTLRGHGRLFARSSGEQQVTAESLYYNKIPDTSLDKYCKDRKIYIYFVPTEQEYRLSLRPFISIKRSQFDVAINNTTVGQLLHSKSLLLPKKMNLSQEQRKIHTNQIEKFMQYIQQKAKELKISCRNEYGTYFFARKQLYEYLKFPIADTTFRDYCDSLNLNFSSGAPGKDKKALFNNLVEGFSLEKPEV